MKSWQRDMAWSQTGRIQAEGAYKGSESWQPGRERIARRWRQTRQWMGKERDASGFTRWIWFGLKIQRHPSGQGLKFQGWPWA